MTLMNTTTRPGYTLMAHNLAADIEAELTKLNNQPGAQKARHARIAEMRRELARVLSGQL